MNRFRGKGGRNQELAAGAALDLIPEEEIVICSLGTDGTDGPTEYAGGIVDGSTLIRAKEKNVDIYRHLARHDILTALKKPTMPLKLRLPKPMCAIFPSAWFCKPDMVGITGNKF